MQKSRKSKVKAVRKRRPLSRRAVMSTLAAGAGALALGGTIRADDEFPQSQLPHWVSWMDGYAYPVHDIDEDGSFVVKFDDGFFAVDPGGLLFDSGVWYAATDMDSEGFWYADDEGNEWLHDPDVILEVIDPGPALL